MHTVRQSASAMLAVMPSADLVRLKMQGRVSPEPAKHDVKAALSVDEGTPGLKLRQAQQHTASTTLAANPAEDTII